MINVTHKEYGSYTCIGIGVHPENSNLYYAFDEYGCNTAIGDTEDTPFEMLEYNFLYTDGNRHEEDYRPILKLKDGWVRIW